MEDILLNDQVTLQLFEKYEKQFKALADQKRLQIMNILTNYNSVCVCDLMGLMNMTQSKLSYHLKILLEANFIHKKTEGTWSYYSLNEKEVNHILSEELCCLFRPSCRVPDLKIENHITCKSDSEENCC